MKQRERLIWLLFGCLCLAVWTVIGITATKPEPKDPAWRFVQHYNTVSISPMETVTEYQDETLIGETYGISVTLTTDKQILTIAVPPEASREHAKQLILDTAHTLNMQVSDQELLDFVKYLGSDLGISDSTTEIRLTEAQGVTIRKFIQES